MAERIPQYAAPDATSDDLIREASAMARLMTTNPEADSPALIGVRRRARDLHARSRSWRGPGGVLHQGEPATRDELDALWALIPDDRLDWARRSVERTIDAAREQNTTATPQTIEMKGSA